MRAVMLLLPALLAAAAAAVTTAAASAPAPVRAPASAAAPAGVRRATVAGKSSAEEESLGARFQVHADTLDGREVSPRLLQGGVDDTFERQRKSTTSQDTGSQDAAAAAGPAARERVRRAGLMPKATITGLSVGGMHSPRSSLHVSHAGGTLITIHGAGFARGGVEGQTSVYVQPRPRADAAHTAHTAHTTHRTPCTARHTAHRRTASTLIEKKMEEKRSSRAAGAVCRAGRVLTGYPHACNRV